MKVVYSLFVAICLLGCIKDSNAESLFNMPIKNIFKNENSLKLALAVKEKRHVDIKKLVATGTDVNLQGEGGFSVLMVALLRDDFKTFSLLLELGADPNLELDNGSSVIYQSVIFEDIKYLKKLLNEGGNPNFYNKVTKKYVLHEAIAPQKLEFVKLLVESGAELDVITGTKFTPLSIAGISDVFDIAYYLLLNGADYSIEDNWGKTIVDTIEESFLVKEAEQYEYLSKAKQFLLKKGVVFGNAKEQSN